MAKNEKIRFDDLEGIFGEPPKVYSEEDLLRLIGSPDQLAEKDRLEQLLIFGDIVDKMRSSDDFRKKVLEEIGKLRR